MMRARRLTTIGLATLVASALAVAPAGAHLARSFSSFAPTGLESPGDVAVEQATGDLFVTGIGSENVEKFSPTGTLETSFVSPSLSFPAGVAVDNSGGSSKGDVYVSERSAGKVVKLDGSGKEVAGFTPIAASSIPAGDPGSAAFVPWGVAVDPANGDVVVGDNQNGEVDIFSSSGAFVSQFAAPGVYGVAVGVGGKIFTTGYTGGGQEWSPSDGYSTPTTVDPASRYAIAVDLSTGDVFADDLGEAGSYIAEYEASGPPLEQFGGGLLETSLGVAAYEAADTAYAVSRSGDLVYVFGPPVVLADVVTATPPTSLTSTTAVLSGTVDPDDTSVTSCRVEYGTSTSYGNTSACSQTPPLTGSVAIPVSGDLSGLQPNMTYHYRLVAVNANGTSYGEDQTFQTSPAVPSIDSESVSALKQTSASVDARINPNNQDTIYRIELGATTVYGMVLPVPGADIGSGYGDVNVGQQFSGLSPGTTYHFRVVATNASSPSGGTAGPDQTFTTPPPQPPIVSTGQAGGVAQNTATLVATIDTQGFQTVYEFDLGTDTSYGTRIFGSAGPEEPGVETFTSALQGLTPGTTYHYRIVATNAFGTSYGVDQTFTTSSYPSSILTAPVAPALVPTALLAPAGTTSSAKAASVKPADRLAARKSSRRPGGHRRKGRPGATGSAHRANRGRGK
jgi:hypothetical protein